MQEVLVSINCPTYNHAKYIRECLEGFLMQETTFEYEVILADDCSFDETPQIVQEFIDNHPKGYRIKYFRHEKNIGMMANGTFSLNNCHAKYVAFCETDDYWTDPSKLQKQVSFLESNDDYGLVHTNIETLNQASGERAIQENPANDGFIFPHLLKTNQVSTLTVLVRKHLLLDAINNGALLVSTAMGDYPLWLEISRKTNIKYLPDITGVYRVLPESTFNTSNAKKRFRIAEAISSIQLHFAEKYDAVSVIRDNIVIHYRNHLYNAGVFYLPESGRKAMDVIKKYDKVNLRDKLLFYISQNKMIGKIINRLRKRSGHLSVSKTLL